MDSTKGTFDFRGQRPDQEPWYGLFYLTVIPFMAAVELAVDTSHVAADCARYVRSAVSGHPIHRRLQAAAQGALRLSPSCLALSDDPTTTSDHLVNLTFCALAGRSKVPMPTKLDSSSASNRRLIDPLVKPLFGR